MELEDAVALGHGKVRRTCIRNSLAPAKERVCDKEFRNLLIEGLVLRAPPGHLTIASRNLHSKRHPFALRLRPLFQAASKRTIGAPLADAGRTFHLESHPG